MAAAKSESNLNSFVREFLPGSSVTMLGLVQTVPYLFRILSRFGWRKIHNSISDIYFHCYSTIRFDMSPREAQ